MSERCNDSCRMAATADRRALRKVLAINLAQSLGGGLGGWAAASTALLGAALDNLADAGVYGLSLYAVGRPQAYKTLAARVSGWLLILLSAGLLFEVLRRLFEGAEPVGPAMMAVAAVNAALNLVCLRILRPRRDQGVNLRASWIFTSNDALVNLGIVTSGALVMVFGSPYPDLIIGVLVSIIAVRGGREILADARAGTA